MPVAAGSPLVSPPGPWFETSGLVSTLPSLQAYGRHPGASNTAGEPLQVSRAVAFAVTVAGLREGACRTQTSRAESESEQSTSCPRVL